MAIYLVFTKIIIVVTVNIMLNTIKIFIVEFQKMKLIPLNVIAWNGITPPLTNSVENLILSNRTNSKLVC